MVLDGCSHVSEVKDTLEKCIGRQISKVETNIFLIYGLAKKIVIAVLFLQAKTFHQSWQFCQRFLEDDYYLLEDFLRMVGISLKIS